MVSLFLAFYDQYSVMFKDSNVFEFNNFPFKTKYNNTVLFTQSIAIVYSRGESKKKSCETIL